MRFFLLKLLMMSIVVSSTVTAYSQNSTVQDTLIVYYTIQSGDNISNLAARFKTTRNLIYVANNFKLSEDIKLVLGHKLKIPKLVARAIPSTDSIPPKVVIPIKISLEDSLARYIIDAQKREDSLFLVYVERDKKKDSIEKSNAELAIIAEIKQRLQDSLVQYNAIKISILKTKDSIYNFNLTIEREEKKKQFSADSIEQHRIAEFRIDSVNKYHDSLINENSIKQKLLEASFNDNLSQQHIDSIKNYNELVRLQKEQNEQSKFQDKIVVNSIDTIPKNQLLSDSVVNSIDTIKTIDSASIVASMLHNEDQALQEKEDARRADSSAFYLQKIDSAESYRITLLYNDSIYNFRTILLTEYNAKLRRDSIADFIKNQTNNQKGIARDRKNTSTSKKSQHAENSSNTTYNYNGEKSSDLSTIEIRASKKKRRHRIGDLISESEMQKSNFYLTRALKSIDLRDYKNAFTYIAKAVSLNPNNTDAYILRADLYSTFNYYDQAVKEYNKAISTNAKLPELFYNRGTNYLKMNELLKALKDFNSAIKLDSIYVLALGGRASINIFYKNFEPAFEDVSTILRLNPFFAPAYKARAEINLATGDVKAAILDCDKFLETNPNDAYIYYQRGMARIKDDEYYKSCLDLLKSSELGYKDADAALRKYCK